MDPTTLIDEVIAREGGYVSRADDRGGPTRWGIAERTARAHGWHGAMAALPRATAAAIYRATYWDAPGLDRVAAAGTPRVAAELFDTGVNMGPATAAGFLRRALNALNRAGADYADVAPAGPIDARVVAALAGFLRVRPTGETVLVRALDALQGERYLALAERRPANEAFLYGWLANRLAQA